MIEGEGAYVWAVTQRKRDEVVAETKVWRKNLLFHEMDSKIKKKITYTISPFLLKYCKQTSLSL